MMHQDKAPRPNRRSAEPSNCGASSGTFSGADTALLRRCWAGALLVVLAETTFFIRWSLMGGKHQILHSV